MSTETAEKNKELVKRFFDAMNSGDVQYIVDSYAEAMTLKLKRELADIAISERQ